MKAPVANNVEKKPYQFAVLDNQRLQQKPIALTNHVVIHFVIINL